MSEEPQPTNPQFEDLSVPSSPYVPLDDMASKYYNFQYMIDSDSPAVDKASIKHKVNEDDKDKVKDVKSKKSKVRYDELALFKFIMQFCEYFHITMPQCIIIIEKYENKRNNKSPVIDLDDEYNFRDDAENASAFNKNVLELMDFVADLLFPSIINKFEHLMSEVSKFSDKVKHVFASLQQLQHKVMENSSFIASLKMEMTEHLMELTENYRYINEYQKEQMELQNQTIIHLKNIILQQQQYGANYQLSPQHTTMLPINHNQQHQMNPANMYPYRHA